MSAVVIDAGGCLGTRETSGGYLVSATAKLPSAVALLCPLLTNLNNEPDGRERYLKGPPIFFHRAGNEERPLELIGTYSAYLVFLFPSPFSSQAFNYFYFITI